MESQEYVMDSDEEAERLRAEKRRAERLRAEKRRAEKRRAEKRRAEKKKAKKKRRSERQRRVEEYYPEAFFLAQKKKAEKRRRSKRLGAERLRWKKAERERIKRQKIEEKKNIRVFRPPIVRKRKAKKGKKEEEVFPEEPVYEPIKDPVIEFIKKQKEFEFDQYGTNIMVVKETDPESTDTEETDIESTDTEETEETDYEKKIVYYNRHIHPTNFVITPSIGIKIKHKTTINIPLSIKEPMRQFIKVLLENFNIVYGDKGKINNIIQSKENLEFIEQYYQLAVILLDIKDLVLKNEDVFRTKEYVEKKNFPSIPFPIYHKFGKIQLKKLFENIENIDKNEKKIIKVKTNENFCHVIMRELKIDTPFNIKFLYSLFLLYHCNKNKFKSKEEKMRLFIYYYVFYMFDFYKLDKKKSMNMNYFIVNPLSNLCLYYQDDYEKCEEDEYVMLLFLKEFILDEHYELNLSGFIKDDSIKEEEVYEDFINFYKTDLSVKPSVSVKTSVRKEKPPPKRKRVEPEEKIVKKRRKIIFKIYPTYKINEEEEKIEKIVLFPQNLEEISLKTKDIVSDEKFYKLREDVEGIIFDKLRPPKRIRIQPLPQLPQLPRGIQPLPRGIPQLPQQLGIPQFPQQLGIPQFPQQLGIPQFPQQLGIPQFPQQLGIPQFPQQLGIPQLPQQLGIPQLPQQLGIPQLPQQLGIPPLPQQLGIPPLPPTPPSQRLPASPFSGSDPGVHDEPWYDEPGYDDPGVFGDPLEFGGKPLTIEDPEVREVRKVTLSSEIEKIGNRKIHNKSIVDFYLNAIQKYGDFYALPDSKKYILSISGSSRKYPELFKTNDNFIAINNRWRIRKFTIALSNPEIVNEGHILKITEIVPSYEVPPNIIVDIKETSNPGIWTIELKGKEETEEKMTKRKSKERMSEGYVQKRKRKRKKTNELKFGERIFELFITVTFVENRKFNTIFARIPFKNINYKIFLKKTQMEKLKEMEAKKLRAMKTKKPKEMEAKKQLRAMKTKKPKEMEAKKLRAMKTKKINIEKIDFIFLTLKNCYYVKYGFGDTYEAEPKGENLNTNPGLIETKKEVLFNMEDSPYEYGDRERIEIKRSTFEERI